jgi:hypothetical protein
MINMIYYAVLLRVSDKTPWHHLMNGMGAPKLFSFMDQALDAGKHAQGQESKVQFIAFPEKLLPIFYVLKPEKTP